MFINFSSRKIVKMSCNPEEILKYLLEEDSDEDIFGELVSDSEDESICEFEMENVESENTDSENIDESGEREDELIINEILEDEDEVCEAENEVIRQQRNICSLKGKNGYR